MKNPVMYVSAAIVLSLAVIGGLWPDAFGAVAQTLLLSTTLNFGWFYLLAVFGMITFLIGLALSRWGTIRLGRDDSRPEFSFFSWIAMLFSTGFGAGLVFWSVAEPMSHFLMPPFDTTEAQSAEAARQAMGYAFFHWGISQWSVFTIAGLGIGILQFRKERDGLVSTALEPVLGRRTPTKVAVDSLAVIATTMGVATSIGLGILQMNGGLDALFGVQASFPIQMALIAAMFVAYIISSISGLDKGMRWLSNLNLALCLILLVFVFCAGPTVFILDSFTLALGDYLSNFVQYSLRMTPYQGGTWVQDWTIFYWAWAIAWSPFIGAFVARVSRGRTIREFIIGVLIIPPMIACIWIVVFGGASLHQDLMLGGDIAEIVDQDVALALFALYRHLPLSEILSVVSILLIFIFLVTSADSATYILASMTTRGSLLPPTFAKVVWGVLMSAIAAVLLASGGLASLQTASLVSALPFTVLLVLIGVALVKLLHAEPIPIRQSDLRRYRRLMIAVSRMEEEKRVHPEPEPPPERSEQLESPKP